MRSRLFRLIARLFAVALLSWTAAELFDYGVCVHHHEWVGAFADTAVRPSPPDQPEAAGAFEDCFCCSRFVNVGHPFKVAVQYAVVWLSPGDTPVAPPLIASSLYHPPLA